MNVLMLNWKDRAHPAAGGAEVWTHAVASRLVDRGHHVTLLVAGFPASRPEEIVDGVRVVRRGGRFSVYSEARRFWRREARGQFDVVFDESNTRPFLAPRWVTDTPVVAQIHQIAGDVWPYEMPLPVAIIGRYLLEPHWLRYYRNVPTLTISYSSAGSLRSRGLRDVRVLPVGGDPIRRPDVAREQRPTIAFVGRLVPSKRPDHAIQAVRLLQRTHPEAQLWIMGAGPNLERLQRLAGNGVEILGHVPFEERQRRLATAHVLVATSVREGWGLVVSEAAALGTPTIGYRIPGLVDSIPASGGFVVDPRPEALADALREFFKGERPLSPRISTVGWDEVACNIEQHLLEATGA